MARATAQPSPVPSAVRTELRRALRVFAYHTDAEAKSERLVRDCGIKAQAAGVAMAPFVLNLRDVWNAEPKRPLFSQSSDRLPSMQLTLVAFECTSAARRERAPWP